MLQATWDWYYGSTEEELLGDCQFGEPFSRKNSSNDSDIVIRPGTYENGDSVNVFTAKSSNKLEIAHLEICSKHLKVLRHPNILRFISWIPLEIECHLITEHAYPLNSLLDIIDAHEICSGLHDIALALQFIHDKACVTHNHVCIDNIFVLDNGPWKLGGFDYACHFEEATKSFLDENLFYAKPPEEKEPSQLVLPVKNEYGHSRDVYMFGLLLDHFFDKVLFSSGIKKSDLRDFVDDIMREDYENRPRIKEILAMPIFKSAYISIVHFLQSVTLRSKSEKEDFFKSFLSKLKSNHIFSEVIGRRIVPLLLTPIVLAEQDAVNHVINDVLTPGSETSVESESDGAVLSESIFARYVIPKIVELFKSRLIHVRVVVLKNFSKFVHLFEESVLKDVVLPEILLGLRDSSNQIVQCSLHALADAIAIVGADTIVGSERERIFSPGIPKFDGRVLNESRALAYEEKIAPRKKLEKKLPPPEPKKPTLLELAMMKKQNDGGGVAPTVEILLKQKRMAHQIAQKSQVKTNGTVVHCSPADKSTRPKVVHQIVQQPDVETWASSEEDDSDTDWPNIDEVSEDDQVAFENSSLSTSVDSRTPLEAEQSDSIQTLPKSVQNSPRSLASEHFNDRLGEEFEIKVDPARTNRKQDVDFFSEMLPDIDQPSNGLGNAAGKQMRNNGRNLNQVNSTFGTAAVDDEESGWSDDSWS